jgi:hypothetical protein
MQWENRILILENLDVVLLSKSTQAPTGMARLTPIVARQLTLKPPFLPNGRRISTPIAKQPGA